MNIGIFTDTYKPNINGVVTSIDIKKREFEKKGHNVYIITSHEPSYIENEKNVIRLKSFTFIFQPEYRLAYPPGMKVLKEIQSLKLDIIHVETPFSAGLLAKYISKKQRIPLVHTYHTLFAEYVHYLRIPKRITKKMAEKISAVFCNRCSHIIAPSAQIKRELDRYGVIKPVSIIPTGIEVKDFFVKSPIDIRKKYNISKDEKLLLFVGRLGKEKNIDFLLEAFKLLLSEKKYEYKFMLVGDGPYKAELLKKVKEYDIEKNVVFAGYVERKDIKPYYQQSDLFIFASQTETQGLVILEAMASSLPVVAIKASGVEDMVKNEESGLLIDDENIDNFNKNINRLIEDTGFRKKIIENAINTALDFTPEKTFDKMLSIYEKLINKKRVRKKRNIFSRNRTFLKIAKYFDRRINKNKNDK